MMLATPDVATDNPIGVGGQRRSRRRPALLIAVGGVLLVLLGIGALAANASLSEQYSPQRAIQDYFRAQQRRDVAAMWANATFDRPDGSYSKFFDKAALAAMMTLKPNSDLHDIRLGSVQDVNSSTKAITVGMIWNGTRRSQQFTLRRDQSQVHWLIYPSWKVQIPSITVQPKLPNQAGPVNLDGIPAPAASQAVLYTITGFHEVRTDPTAILQSSVATVDARDPLPTATLTGTLQNARLADAGTALRKAFDACDVATYDGCFNHTYLARDNKFIYYMTVPGYGDVNYTMYSYALTGDPTSGMKLTVEPQPGDVTIAGSCTSTLTVNGTRTFQMKGDFTGKLHWDGGAFNSDVSWDCAKTKA